ncbi:hypothetical protein PISMIDRAFT_16091 [Pisolithus microcarpus 441]|uniref:Uncharacterized protein n=1 Tax=Pisolithus microcarpus 441 TaxID=765257 RepID=A0A0C9Z197_9AGAM|nr:hypothetical protein PISMIDRAFT_16091 [Pisolithus microcarpus 441]
MRGGAEATSVTQSQRSVVLKRHKVNFKPGRLKKSSTRRQAAHEGDVGREPEAMTKQ